jgi:hypothetical protein
VDPLLLHGQFCLGTGDARTTSRRLPNSVGDLLPAGGLAFRLKSLLNMRET